MRKTDVAKPNLALTAALPFIATSIGAINLSPAQTMALPLLPSIDIAEFDTQQRGLCAKSLSPLGSIYTTVTLQNLDHAITFLQQHVSDFAVHINATALPSLDNVVSLLDAGAGKVFVSYT